MRLEAPEVSFPSHRWRKVGEALRAIVSRTSPGDVVPVASGVRSVDVGGDPRIERL
jgi:hypothetical protein